MQRIHQTVGSSEDSCSSSESGGGEDDTRSTGTGMSKLMLRKNTFRTVRSIGVLHHRQGSFQIMTGMGITAMAELLSPVLPSI